MLRHGPVLAHEFGNVAPCALAERLHKLNLTLPDNWEIISRWVHAPGRFGLRIHEKLYTLRRTDGD